MMSSGCLVGHIQRQLRAVKNALKRERRVDIVFVRNVRDQELAGGKHQFDGKETGRTLQRLL